MWIGETDDGDRPSCQQFEVGDAETPPRSVDNGSPEGSGSLEAELVGGAVSQPAPGIASLLSPAPPSLRSCPITDPCPTLATHPHLPYQ